LRSNVILAFEDLVSLKRHKTTTKKQQKATKKYRRLYYNKKLNKKNQKNIGNWITIKNGSL